MLYNLVLYKQDKESVSMNRVMNRILKWCGNLILRGTGLEDKPAVVVEVVERTRLREDQYLALERKMVPPIVSGNTTELQAAYALGVQTVLKELRDGFVARS